MIIKLNSLISIARQREQFIETTLTKKDHIKGDRWVMLILFTLAIIVAAIVA